MRTHYNENSKHLNIVHTNYLVKSFSKLIGVKSNVMSHILYLTKLATVHIIALEARKSDERLNDLKIEIPYFGCVKVKLRGNDIVSSEFLFEDEFKEELIEAIKIGDSKLSKEIDKRLISKLQEKYNEFI